MANIQYGNNFYDSDDELPSLDTLLSGLPSRIQQPRSQSKPISNSNLKDFNLIELEDGNTSVEEWTDDKAATPEQAIPPSSNREGRKRWQSSPEQFGDGVSGGEGKLPRSQGRLINKDICEYGPQESDLEKRQTTRNKSNIPSKLKSQASIKQPRGPLEIGDVSDSALGLHQLQIPTAERFRTRNQEESLTQHPCNVSPNGSQITKSSHQPKLPEHQDGKYLLRPLSRLWIAQDEPNADNTSFPITPPKKSKQKKQVSPHRGIHAKEAPEEPRMDAGQHQKSDDEWYQPDIDCNIKSARSTAPKPTSKKQTKKSFDARKSQLAIDFLQQLDTQITHGKIGELTQSTGGVKLVWSNTLKTTAGRANWKRVTAFSKHADDSAYVDVKQYRHHSSIELSEKVIDDESRLLNVIAHEFCHLANFMISGITDNPHGKEFKVWAAKCSQLFGPQGVNVTTKHSYEIEFKYVWACTACGCEYKRHSKSIDLKRHRCGACKASLEQTKPTPRQTPTSQLSRYQLFVKEQMKVVKSEDPNRAQKEIMRIVAERWAKVKV